MVVMVPCADSADGTVRASRKPRYSSREEERPFSGGAGKEAKFEHLFTPPMPTQRTQAAPRFARPAHTHIIHQRGRYFALARMAA